MFTTLIIGFGVGVIVTIIIAYFVARNNKAKAIELLNIDFKNEINRILADTDVDDKIREFLEDIKKKF